MTDCGLPSAYFRHYCGHKNYQHIIFNMPPTPQAVEFVISQVWTPVQLQDFICSFVPGGISTDLLQTALGLHELGELDYIDNMITAALRLVMAGHQRSPEQVLQEMGALPVLTPHPPIEVCIVGFSFCLFRSFKPVLLTKSLTLL